MSAAGNLGAKARPHGHREAKHTLKKSTFKRALTALAAPVLAMCITAATPARQGGVAARYVYDDNGRLHAVITPAGEAAVYEYDAAGNITAVRRLPATALALFDFSPRAGVPGDLVTLVGVGLGGGFTGVSFNGAAARVVSTTPSALVVEVPQGATTGPITVTTAAAAAVSSRSFNVRGVRLSPAAARVFFGEAVQFTASVVTDEDPALTWGVNDIAGGDSSFGTVSPGGLYAAPSVAGTFIVRATLASDTDFYAEAQVAVRDPDDAGELRAPPVSVRRGFLNGSRVIGSIIAVRRGNADGVGSAHSAPASVGYGGRDGQTAASGSVSATKGPYVASVAPATVTTGTDVTLTITGMNLSGASALRFVSPINTAATGLTLTNIVVNADGTSLTATLAVASTAATGQYVFVVITPAGDSGGNPIRID